MARGAWDPMAHLLANLACDPEEDGEPYSPADFHPLRISKARETKASDVLPYDPAVLIAIANKGK